jgi:hypothetical protein
MAVGERKHDVGVHSGDGCHLLPRDGEFGIAVEFERLAGEIKVTEGIAPPPAEPDGKYQLAEIGHCERCYRRRQKSR